MTELADPPRHAPSPAPQSQNGAAEAPISRPRFLADIYEDASRCNKCSLCQAVCPTYVVNPVEWETARGRVSLVRDAIEGRLELRDIADGPLSTCLACNNCMAACAPAVPTAEIVTRARQELQAQEGHPFLQTLALRGILPHPLVLRLIHGAGRAAEVTGLLPLARRGGVTRWMGLPGGFAEHLGTLPRRTAYRRARGLPGPQQSARGRLGFVMCCYQNLTAPEATEATLRVLAANGYEIVVPTLGCTGLPAKTLGDRDAMLEMARKTVEILRELRVDALVGDVASCTMHVRDYGHLLADDRFLATDARRLSESLRLASDLLADAGMLAPLGRLRWTVAIDEPCALPHGSPERSAPRRLLSQIPGLRQVPLEEAAMCCAGAGAYFHSQPERSAAILARKFEHVVASGAEVLVTENISCLNQLREGARRHAPHVRVLHVFEVLQASIEAEQRRSAARER
jgi:glycolate oxidase iron-sulfur subunit